MEAVGGQLDGVRKVQDLEVVLRQSDARARRRRIRLNGGGNKDDTEDHEERALIEVLELVGWRHGTSADIGQDLQPPPKTLLVISP